MTLTSHQLVDCTLVSLVAWRYLRTRPFFKRVFPKYAKLVFLALLPPATKLLEGNVLTPVCDSVHGGVSVQGRSLSRGVLSRGVFVQGVSFQGGLSKGVSVRETPLRYRADGAHPTGMHSC